MHRQKKYSKILLRIIIIYKLRKHDMLHVRKKMHRKKVPKHEMLTHECSSFLTSASPWLPSLQQAVRCTSEKSHEEQPEDSDGDDVVLEVHMTKAPLREYVHRNGHSGGGIFFSTSRSRRICKLKDADVLYHGLHFEGKMVTS